MSRYCAAAGGPHQHAVLKGALPIQKQSNRSLLNMSRSNFHVIYIRADCAAARGSNQHAVQEGALPAARRHLHQRQHLRRTGGLPEVHCAGVLLTGTKRTLRSISQRSFRCVLFRSVRFACLLGLTRGSYPQIDLRPSQHPQAVRPSEMEFLQRCFVPPPVGDVVL